MSSLFATMIESVAARLSSDNQDIVKNSTERYTSLDLDVLLTIWFQWKLFCYSDWFSSRTEMFWDTKFVNKTEIKRICPHDKLRDSHMESYPLQAFSSYSFKSLGKVGGDTWVLQREAWESLTSVTMKGGHGFWRSLASRWRHWSLLVEVEWHKLEIYDVLVKEKNAFFLLWR